MAQWNKLWLRSDAFDRTLIKNLRRSQRFRRQQLWLIDPELDLPAVCLERPSVGSTEGLLAALEDIRAQGLFMRWSWADDLFNESGTHPDERPLESLPRRIFYLSEIDVTVRRGSGNAPIAARSSWLTDTIGDDSVVATLLQVTEDQARQWRTGETSPPADHARALLDLDHVVARAHLMWGDTRIVHEWLTSPNAYLDGATPVDTIRTKGVTAVIDALDEAAQEAYA